MADSTIARHENSTAFTSTSINAQYIGGALACGYSIPILVAGLRGFEKISEYTARILKTAIGLLNRDTKTYLHCG
jgi:hypothetical protein